jgi:DNA-binding transcriptional MerR regulator
VERARREGLRVGISRRSDLTRPRYIISIAAELASCHPRTLRIYEEEGLLRPPRRQRVNLAGVRVILQLEEAGKIRVYDLFDEDDVERFAEENDETVTDTEPKLDEQSAEGATQRGN